MKILGIDTSTRFLCIGIYEAGRGIAEYRMDLGNKHSSYILPTIERILGSLKIKPKDLDYLAVGLGPGSFTGIRIGLSVIKGLAYALKKSIVGISSLDILALNAKSFLEGRYESDRVRICPVIDAKRNLIFTSIYGFKNGYLKRLMPYRLISPEELVKKVPRRTIFLGDGLKLYREIIGLKVKEAVFLDTDYWYPRPGSIIELARQRIARKKIDNLKTVQPLYLYPKECQIRK